MKKTWHSLKNRVTAMLLALICVLGLLPTAALAAGADTSGAAQSVHDGVLAATATDNQHVLGQERVQHYGLAVTLVR